MSLVSDRKRRHTATVDCTSKFITGNSSALDPSIHPNTLSRQCSSDRNRKIRTRVTVQTRLKSSLPPSPAICTRLPRTTPALSSSHPPHNAFRSPLLSNKDMGQTPITGSALRLMNYLSTEWADGTPAPGSQGNNLSGADHRPDPGSRASAQRSADLMPAKHRLSREPAVDLTLSPEPHARSRRMRLRHIQQGAARNSSPVAIRVPPPGDSSEEEENERDNTGIDVLPSAPPLQSEGSQEGWRGRRATGKRPLHEEASINMHGGDAPAGSRHLSKRLHTTGRQQTLAPNNTTTGPNNLPADMEADVTPQPQALSHQPSHASLPLSSPPIPVASAPPSLPTAMDAQGSRAQGPITASSTTGVKEFVTNLLSHLPTGSAIHPHGAVLQSMLQGNIGIQPKVVAVQQALADLSETIENKTEQLMGSYAQLLQQHMAQAGELEALRVGLRDKDAQLAERENTIQQLQTALLEAQTVATSSSSALATARREVEQSKEAFQQEVLCQICFEKRKSVLLMPCLHFLYCQDCVSRCFQQAAGRTCPTCRTAVAGTMNVHLQAS